MAYQLTQDCIDMDVEMSASAHSVLVVLCRHANDAGECFPSTALIAKKAHLNPRTVMQAVKELEQGEWISSTQEPGKRRRFLIDGAKIQSFVSSEVNGTPAESYTPVGNCTPVKRCSTPLQETAVHPCRKLQDTPVGNCTRIEHIKEQEKDREETAPASNPESGTCDVTASDLCPSVDAFALSSETPKAAEKPKKGKKAKKGNAEEVDFYDLPESMIRDWKTHRGTTAKITQTVVDAFRREAEKVGKTLEFAVRYSIEHNWRGFFAKWYLKEEAKSGGESVSNVGTLPDQSRNPFYFPDGGRSNRKTTEVPRDYDATAEASDLVGRMLG